MKRIPSSILNTAVLATAFCVGVASSDGPAPMKDAVKMQPETASAEVKVAPATLNKRSSAKWTATTYEAATAEAHKKVLASGRDSTVTGEIVDVSCYLQLGKRGEAHVACGSKCIANGQPIGILDANDNLFILFAEEHHPRRDGTVDIRKVFAPMLAKTVTVSGMMTDMRGYRALFVPAAEMGAAVTTAAPGDKK